MKSKLLFAALVALPSHSNFRISHRIIFAVFETKKPSNLIFKMSETEAKAPEVAEEKTAEELKGTKRPAEVRKPSKIRRSKSGPGVG